MTHDPLCHLSRETGEFNLMADRCYYCKLIAKVRADERKQATTTHDPMCDETWSHPDFRGMHDFRGAYDGVCPMCHLIAKVRADERQQCVTEIEDAHASVDEDGKRWHHCDYLVAHAALERAADRLRTAS